jgi:tripartite-type tricarboxylate transporter receptor subunit TctC
MISRRTAICLAVIGLSTATSIGSVSAADYPTRPVKWVVGYPPGGATDIIARLIGQRLSERLGQQFVIENKPGAGNNIATESVINAEPDGYTLLLVNPANYINASLYANLKFNVVRDIAPIAAFNRVPNVMTVNKDVPAKTVAEFIAYVKANPGKVNLASSGNGTSVHLSGEMFMAMSGAKMQHVPYRGAAPAITDLLGGQVQVIFDNMPSILQHVRAGSEEHPEGNHRQAEQGDQRGTRRTRDQGQAARPRRRTADRPAGSVWCDDRGRNRQVEEGDRGSQGRESAVI